MSSGIIWFTGLSGAGKTTIANAVIKELRSRSIHSILLDGDEIRNVFHNNSFDRESRIAHNLQVGRLASLLEVQEIVVVVALISPYEHIRNEIRQMSRHFIEIYVATDLETCILRDQKGLYKRALAGEIKNFTGINAPYNPPKAPDITLDTVTFTAEECASQVIQYFLG